MSILIKIYDDILEKKILNSIEIENNKVLDYIFTSFKGKWPRNAKIYLNEIKPINDITPYDEYEIDRLNNLSNCTLHIIYFPEDPETAAYVAIAIAIAATAASFILAPKIPNQLNRNTQSVSPNNELSDRVNTARPNARIPDIYGTVNSVPDLLTKPYALYTDNKKVEHCFMCIGRGSYNIKNNIIYDDTTDVSKIEGAQVEVYGPYTSPNFGSPQLTVGGAIARSLYGAARFNGVNGQIVMPPNANKIIGNSNIRFMYPNKIEMQAAANVSMTDVFKVNDPITITNASYYGPTNSGFQTVNLNGTYTVQALDETSVTLLGPSTINSDWGRLNSYTAGGTDYISATLQSISTNRWIGPFIVSNTEVTRLLFNFVALNGLYKDDGTNQTKTDVGLYVGITPLDDNEVASGPEVLHDCSLYGSAVVRTTRAASIEIDISSKVSVRVRRYTDANLTFKGQVVDDVKWEDLYFLKKLNNQDFGNVTTLQTVTVSTEGALAVKERKLNAIVSRLIPVRTVGSFFSDDLRESSDVAEIICAMTLDPYIGRRKIAEIDVDNIYGAVAAVKSNFGIDTAASFNYTFDTDNLSYEEMVTSVAQAGFCTPYREGNVLMLTPDIPKSNSSLLFNHRNKIPNSENREINFGMFDDNDSIIYKYIDPDTNILEQIVIPNGVQGYNPKTIESIGIRNKLQAYFHVMRIWQKILYQKITITFEALSEAQLLLPLDKILVADNTKGIVYDGEILDWDGNVTLTLSQPVEYDKAIDQPWDYLLGVEYTIFIQNVSGQVESISVIDFIDENTITLNNKPTGLLSFDENNSVKATYLLVQNTDYSQKEFLLTERSTTENNTVDVTAINYDIRYFDKDKDYINGIVNSKGNVI